MLCNTLFSCLFSHIQLLFFCNKKREETISTHQSTVSSLTPIRFLKTERKRKDIDMIRFFDAFRKSIFNKTSDLLLFTQACDTFSADDFVCPKCGRKHACSNIQSYSRHLISYENATVICRRISVRQVQCSSCHSIHAVLPDCLVPYSSYSFSFILTVLHRYFSGTKTIEDLCLHFQISVSTLYAWIRQFQKHKRLWLGILQDGETTAIFFLKELLSGAFSPDDFFSTYRFSFLQYAFTTFSNSS